MKYLSILFLIFCSQISFCQEISNSRWIAQDTTTSPISIIAFWKNGEIKDYYMSNKKNKYEEDSLISSKSINENITRISVLDSSEKSYTLQYEIINNLKKLENSSFKQMANVVNDIKDQYTDSDFTLRYKTDELGAFDSYIDPEKTYAACDKIMETVKKKTLENLDKKVKNLNPLLDKLMTGQKLFETMFGVNISNFHNLFGLKMGENDTLAFDETNDVLENKLTARCILYINSIDTISHDVEYVIEKTYDSEDFSQYLNALFAKNKEIKKAIKNVSYDVFIKSQYFINYTTGWPTNINIIKNTSVYEENKPATTEKETYIIDSRIPKNEK